MRKYFFILFLFLSLTSFCLASNSSDDSLLESFKKYRLVIYSNLNLSNSQIEKIKELDNVYYDKFSIHTSKMTSLVDDVKAKADSGIITLEYVNDTKNQLKSEDRAINIIKDDYEKEFKKILTPKQKIKYSLEKRKLKNKLKKEMKMLKNSQKFAKNG